MLPVSNWVGKTLLSFPQSIYAGVDDDVAHLRQPQDLENEQVISSETNAQWLFRGHEEVQWVQASQRMVLSSPEMRLEAASKNLGIAKLPDYVCQSSSQCNKLKKVVLSKQPVALQLTVLYQNRNIPLKTRAFLDYFQSRIGCLAIE